MKTYGIILTIILIFSIWKTEINAQTIMNYSLNNTEGEEIQISDISGEKLTVLDFWATWCKPCVQAIPHIIKLSDEFKEDGVRFIGINTDSPRNSSKIKPFAFSKGINYPILLDSDQELMNDLFVDFLPTILIYDENGELLFTHRGYVPGDEKIIKNEIIKLLDE